MGKKDSFQIIELIGPAGSGKTTLFKALVEEDENIVLGSELEMRKFRNLLPFINHLPSVLPILFSNLPSDRQFTWDEIKFLVYLDAWPVILKKQAMMEGTKVILDHGPVFKLATLREFGPTKLRQPRFDDWWQTMYDRWGETLDMLIWLDAPDSILAERINSRGQSHIVKGKSKPDVTDFLSRSRKALTHTIEKTISSPGPKLIKFDSSESKVDQIVSDILMAYNMDKGEETRQTHGSKT